MSEQADRDLQVIRRMCRMISWPADTSIVELISGPDFESAGAQAISLLDAIRRLVLDA